MVSSLLDRFFYTTSRYSTVQGGGAGRQQPLTNPRVQIQVAVALHGLHQVGQCRLEPLAADPVGSFPDQDYCFSHGLVVDAPALFYRQLPLSVVAGLSQQPDAMLAMVAGNRDELVQDQAFLPRIASNRMLPKGALHVMTLARTMASINKAENGS